MVTGGGIVAGRLEAREGCEELQRVCLALKSCVALR